MQVLGIDEKQQYNHCQHWLDEDEEYGKEGDRAAERLGLGNFERFRSLFYPRQVRSHVVLGPVAVFWMMQHCKPFGGEAHNPFDAKGNIQGTIG